MGKVLRAIVFGIVGAIALAAATFAGGFGLAWLLGPSAQQLLGMLVPMMLVPLAFVVGLGGGAWYGWKRA